MTVIQIKHITDPVSPNDGYRVFVDRLYPRGIRKERFIVDLWAKEITPSTQLRQWFHKDQIHNWEGFCQKYTSELSKNTTMVALVKQISSYPVVTLVTDVKDVEHSHVPIIQSFIKSNLK